MKKHDMKKMVSVVLMSFALVGAMATSSLALSLNFSSVGNAQISFNGTSDAFTFPDSTVIPTGRDFQIGSVTGGSPGANTVGLVGNIGGTYTIGAITTTGPLQEAPVSGTGTFEITDANNQFLTATLTWININTLGTSGNLNAFGSINLSNIAYSGTNADLLALKQDANGGIATATFQFVPALSLTQLTAAGASHSATYSGAAAPVPEPTSLLLLGLGLVGLGLWKRKAFQS